MTQLPFEDLPEKPAKPPPNRFSEFWAFTIRKVAKRDAQVAYKAALKRADEDVILTAWAAFNRMMHLDIKFIPYPATWLRRSRWEDEYDTPSKRDRDSELAWQNRALMAKTDWGRHCVARQDIEECHRRGLLTDDELAEALR